METLQVTASRSGSGGPKRLRPLALSRDLLSVGPLYSVRFCARGTADQNGRPGVFGRKKRKGRSTRPGETASAAARPDPPDGSATERIGRYTIERVLGQGGMGMVYLGHDPVIGR